MIEALKQINLVEFMRRCWQTEFQRRGDTYVGLSPFRAETKASLYVQQQADGHWTWFDHGSGRGGTIIDAVMARDGHADVGLALRTARQLAAEAGLLPPDFPAGEAEPGRLDLEGLLNRLRANEAGAARAYLQERGISLPLVEKLSTSGLLVVNQVEQSRYCCFVVRDGAGRLRGLVNRKIDGPAEREKFLLGEQYPFCLNWERLAQSLRVHVCESIIDGLSVLTIEPGACVLSLPGAHYDLARAPLPPPPARLVAAFDGDEAGQQAAGRLRRQYPQHGHETFALYGAHDVNELLCRGKDAEATPSGKLNVADRVEIALSEEPSRELAARYGVHHSRICSIRHEARRILDQEWAERRPGRKAKPEPPADLAQTRETLRKLQEEHELLTMRKEWLELRVQILEERPVEEVRAAKERKKKMRRGGGGKNDRFDRKAGGTVPGTFPGNPAGAGGADAARLPAAAAGPG
jgi:hypothetical protein